MADTSLKISRGLEKDLPETLEDGHIYFCYDTNNLYIGQKNGNIVEKNQPNTTTWYGTCDTAETTAAKVVTLSNYALTTGSIVFVKFTNAVPANATMNINNRGAKSIYYKGAAIPASIIKAGDTATFIYNSQYHLISIDRWQNDINSLLPKSGGTLTGKLTASSDGITTTKMDSADTFTLTAGSTVYLSRANSSSMIFLKGSSDNARFDASGHFIPGANKTYNIGSSEKAWKNVYADNFSGNTFQVASKATMQYNETDECIEFVFT